MKPRPYTGRNATSDVRTDTFEALVRATQVEIRVYIGVTGVPARDVDDVAQETYLEYYRNMGRKPDNVDPRAWLKGIARNLCRSYFRKHGRRQDLFAAHVSEVLVAHEQEWTAPLAEADLLARLRECLDRVAPRNREIVELYYRDGFASDEIGRRVGVHAGAVRKTLTKVRRSLKDCITRLRGWAD